MIKSISISEDMEKKILNIHSNKYGAVMLKHLLREEKLNISMKDAEWVFDQVWEVIREKHDDALLLRGFSTRLTDDGEISLQRYVKQTIRIRIDTGDRDYMTVTKADVSVSKNEYVPTPEQEVIIPSEISKLDPYCFNGRKHIRRVVIPDGVKMIPGYSFGGCTNLEEVIIPDTVTVIGTGAFFLCKKLNSIRLPLSLAEIGPEAFCGCESLRRIKLPETLRKISYGAFAFCTGLDSLEVPENIVIPPEKLVFYGSSVTCSSSGVPERKEEPVESVMKDLGDALDIFVNAAIHISCITYAITIQEIESPADDHIEDLVSETEWKEDIAGYLNGTSWIILDDQYKWEGRLSQEHTDYLSQMIAGTLEKYGGEMFRASQDGLDFYEEEHQCIDLISLRFLHVRNKWYILLFEWYD